MCGRFARSSSPIPSGRAISLPSRASAIACGRPIEVDAMDITTLIKPEHVFALRLGDKALLLKELAGRAAERTGIAAETIAEALAAREALGSTGVGQGVAIPHARIPGLQDFFTLFVKLERPIE